jgi:predicted dehydrogenase
MAFDDTVPAQSLLPHESAATFPGASHQVDRLFRLAIVGCGEITAGAHLPAALASPCIQVVALVDTVLARARALAHQFGIAPALETDVRRILEHTDGVVIATPNHTHCELAVECLEAGVPVLIEKPLATSVKEGEQIARAAEKDRATVAVGYSTRFYESVLLMRSLLQSGYFGRVRRFAYQFGTIGGWSPLSAYTLDRHATGGGVLVVTGSHVLDRILHWFGYPDDFQYSDDSLGGPEANALAIFRYARGPAPFDGMAQFSKTVPLRAGFVVQTEKGSVVIHEGPDAPIRFRPLTQPSLELIVCRRDGPLYSRRKNVFQLQLEDFVDACRTKREPMASAHHGLQSLRLIEELYSRRQPLKTDWYGSLEGASES